MIYSAPHCKSLRCNAVLPTSKNVVIDTMVVSSVVVVSRLIRSHMVCWSAGWCALHMVCICMLDYTLHMVGICVLECWTAHGVHGGADMVCFNPFTAGDHSLECH